MTTYKIDFADEAWAAVQTQARHIAVERKSPVNAARWLDRLLDAADTLESLPTRYAVDAAESISAGVEVHRLVFERTYLMFYTIDEAALLVTIIAFRHGARRGQ